MLARSREVIKPKLQVCFSPCMTMEIKIFFFSGLTVFIFRATSERLKSEIVTEALKRCGDLQQSELPGEKRAVMAPVAQPRGVPRSCGPHGRSQ